jgi:hypothetical protein
MNYKLLDNYYFEQSDDQVSWIRIFTDERRMMTGRGVYRDDVLVLLFPSRIDEIDDPAAVREKLGMDSLPEWNKTKYLIHMGTVNQGYPVQEAIHTADGSQIDKDELQKLVDRIESVFK